MGGLRYYARARRTSERHFNIHTDPETMAGHYANFANVCHSDYEFTITFARVDHEVEEGEVPGVVVSRINLSPRFMRELIDAMEDNFSKWQTREGIRDLPEFGPGGGGTERRLAALAAPAHVLLADRHGALDRLPVEVVGRVRGPVVVGRELRLVDPAESAGGVAGA